jgi:hypothetical protein
MIVVIGGLTIILVLCGSLLHTLLRLDRSGRESINSSATLARLARQFRRDVRSSQSAKPGDPGSLELTRPDGPSVTYQETGGRLIREEHDGKKLARREAYAVSRLGPLRFELDGKLVRLVADRHPSVPSAPAGTAVRVEARLDKDRDPAEPEEARR